ncbi:hypothetical protein HO133_008646 [Letharia lupina]|uniref:Uncharacterized protein n=1 Tax=Letharia lupina TaxID=560253 RepID=A0A8H6CPA3_9LECA|nr:uncharacterized protein HO133_008646 [Letharia lupina]KAF6227204.1 hypothetical protein HO133_008646 [Letharia lupina]
MYHGQFRGSENLTWVTVRPAILVLQQAKFETHSEEVPFQSASTVMGKDRLTKHQFAALKSALLILQDPCGVRGSWGNNKALLRRNRAKGFLLSSSMHSYGEGTLIERLSRFSSGWYAGTFAAACMGL